MPSPPDMARNVFIIFLQSRYGVELFYVRYGTPRHGRRDFLKTRLSCLSSSCLLDLDDNYGDFFHTNLSPNGLTRETALHVIIQRKNVCIHRHFVAVSEKSRFRITGRMRDVNDSDKNKPKKNESYRRGRFSPPTGILENRQ